MRAKLNVWEGDKVRLRAVSADDWQAFHNNRYDSESERSSWKINVPRSPEAARKWAEDLALSPPYGDNASYAIENLDGELVGSINSHNTQPRNGTLEYGLGIFREHWRKGYASDAICILLRYFFNELRYQKANAIVYSFNEGSIKLHESLGFKMEGRQRRMIFTNGKHHDVILYGMTSDEFRERFAQERLARPFNRTASCPED